MSEHSDAVRRREAAVWAVRSAIIALAAAGSQLMAGRDCYPADAQELATAMREDIKTMIGDAEALLAVIQGR